MKRKYYLIICGFFVAIVIFTKDHLEPYYSKLLNQFVNNGNQVEYNIYRSRLSDHFIDDKTHERVWQSNIVDCEWIQGGKLENYYKIIYY